MLVRSLMAAVVVAWQSRQLDPGSCRLSSAVFVILIWDLICHSGSVIAQCEVRSCLSLCPCATVSLVHHENLRANAIADKIKQKVFIQ